MVAAAGVRRVAAGPGGGGAAPAPREAEPARRPGANPGAVSRVGRAARAVLTAVGGRQGPDGHPPARGRGRPARAAGGARVGRIAVVGLDPPEAVAPDGRWPACGPPWRTPAGPVAVL